MGQIQGSYTRYGLYGDKTSENMYFPFLFLTMACIAVFVYNYVLLGRKVIDKTGNRD